MRYIKLKSLLSKTITERAAEFINNSNPSHIIDMDKETEKSEDSKLMKGEFDTIDEEGNMISTDERQVGKPHVVNKTVTSVKDYSGTVTDPFVPFN